MPPWSPEDLELAPLGRVERRLGLRSRFWLPRVLSEAGSHATIPVERHPLPGLATLLLRRPPGRAPCRGICLDLGDGLGAMTPTMEEIALAAGLALAGLAPPKAGPTAGTLSAAVAAVEAAARWVLHFAASEYGPTSRVVLTGESGGAHLALATALRRRDRLATGAGGRPFAGLVLRHGAYDLGGSAGDPSLHPLDAELRGLPPSLLLGGLQDPLLDETRLLARRMTEAGCAAELILLPEDPRSAPPARRGTLATHTAAYLRAWLEAR
jgi:hypothetical protein